ncbi:hypothetical protein AX16_004960 [Volvariella volvacea WC 439]|nr:hypothetical protein AX16_004960 [Volvariella volvacea WC 439]
MNTPTNITAYFNALFQVKNDIYPIYPESQHRLTTSPLRPFDRHVSSRLSLKVVKPLSGIISTLMCLCDSTVSSYTSTHPNIKPPNKPDASNKWGSDDVKSAHSLAACHISNTLPIYRSISTMLLHPDTFASETPIIYGGFLLSEAECGQGISVGALALRHPSTFDGPGLQWDKVEASLQRKVDKVREHGSVLGMWYYLSSRDAWDEEIIWNLVGKRSRKPHWTTATTSDHPMPPPAMHAPMPVDAPSPPWAGLMSDEPLETRGVEQERRPASASRRNLEAQPHTTVRAPKKPQYRYPPSRARPRVDEFLQNAWAQAVRDDCTFIVFHCGKYERIGIRHREMQTLYLSDVIDTEQFGMYGKLQLGLHIAMVKDAMERMEERERQMGRERQMEERKEKRKRKDAQKPADRMLRKRKREASPERERESKRKRANVQSKPSELTREVSIEEMKRETSTRKLALVNFRFGALDSPRPSSFLRHEVIHIGETLVVTHFDTPNPKNKYPPKDYMSITVGKYIGGGASGAVHEGTLSVTTKDGETLLVPKVALKFLTRKMDHFRSGREYWMYESMERRGVTGVPAVFGLFYDLETGCMMLVMQHTGMTIREIRSYLREGQELVTREQRKEFLRILGEVHRAGVRHRDIRGPNLMIDQSGQPYIIDFNSAHLDANEDKNQARLKDEFNRMERLLAGEKRVVGLSEYTDVDEQGLEAEIDRLPFKVRILLRPERVDSRVVDIKQEEEVKIPEYEDENEDEDEDNNEDEDEYQGYVARATSFEV